MIDPKIIKQIIHQVHNSMLKDIHEFSETIEYKIQEVLQTTLTRLTIVSREEFSVQKQILLNTQEKIKYLDQRLSKIEKFSSNIKNK